MSSGQNLIDLAWLIFLLAMLGYFCRDRQRLAKARNWLITKGHITLFEWIKEGHRLWPKIEYTYQVTEQNFYGDHLFLGTFHNPHSKYARKIAYRAAIAYEQDSEIDVFYNPDNPEEAALDVSIPGKLNFIIALLVMLLLLHLGMIAARLM